MTELNGDIPRWGFGEVLRLSAPASAGMLSRTITQFVDSLMVSRLGPAVFAGQSIGGLIAFIPESFALGVIGVVNTFVSQNGGAGRNARCGQYTWAGLALVAVYMAFVLPLAGLGQQIFSLVGHDPLVQPMEALYFRYMILAMPITLAIKVLEGFFYGIHRPSIVFVAAFIANALNALGDYALIFGKFGFPQMGLKGAAIATLCCWAIQLAILATVFLMPSMHQRYKTRRPRDARLWQCKDIMRIGWPAGLSFAMDVITWSVFTVILIGAFGTVHLAAANAAGRYMHLSFMPAIGISIAVTALVGKYVGKGRPDVAIMRTKAAAVVAVVYMGACGVAFLLLRHTLIRVFVNADPGMATDGIDPSDIVTYGGRMMICAAVFQMFDAIGIVYSGALRGAGDTRWPMVISVSLAFVMLVGGGSIMVKFLPQLTSLGPYMAATAYVMVFGLAMLRRFRSGKWQEIDLLGAAEGPAEDRQS